MDLVLHFPISLHYVHRDNMALHHYILKKISIRRFHHFYLFKMHVLSTMVKAIHSWKPISKRPIGRPKTRWEDDVRKDIQKLKVPNWNTFVQDRRRWKELVEKAKTLHKEL